MTDGPDYHRESLDLFNSMISADAEGVDDYDYLRDELMQTDEYQALESSYSSKYEPKKGEFEWYQRKHSCFYITPFVAALIETAVIDAEDIVILTSVTHSVVCFALNGVRYYADPLVEWESVNDLERFMGEIQEAEFWRLDGEGLVNV